MKEFAPEDLSQFDGKEGRPVHIVHEGRVYDVTNSKLWKGGLHMRRHHAGTDLTSDIKAAPHGTEVLERYPQVGIVKKEKEDAPPEKAAEVHSGLMRLLDRYPMLKRHPHPMTVHFPIVFMLSTVFFNVLYCLTGEKSFELSGLYCLAGGLSFIPVAMVTGLLSWWINYMAQPILPVKIKMGVSLILLLDALTVFTWRMAVPDILEVFLPASLVYLLLMLFLVPLVIVIGWFGAKLTFPIEEG